ncbi:MAG: hypothetical protein E5Y29_31390, partial [Mesorhizobium sp.]
HQVMELINVPRTKLQAEAIPDTWPARKQLYPDVVKRLEVLAQVEEMARKALSDWTIEIDRDPCDAHVFDPAAGEDGEELRMAAWR